MSKITTNMDIPNSVVEKIKLVPNTDFKSFSAIVEKILSAFSYPQIDDVEEAFQRKSMTIDETVYATAAEYAKANGLTRTDVLELAVDEYLANLADDALQDKAVDFFTFEDFTEESSDG